jgi:hypothetical protein
VKKLILTSLFFVSVYTQIIAQTTTSGNVGVGTVSPSFDAILDISATDRGLLIPRLNTVQINNIFTLWGQCQPGLLVFNIDDKLFYYNSSSNLASPPNWQSFPLKKCPTGFVAVGNEYCIQSQTNNIQQWTDAIRNCRTGTGLTGAAPGTDTHLCSFAEWFAACDLNSPSINNMIGLGEWVDDATGTNEALTIGVGACGTNAAVTTSTQKAYRCCFRR